MIRGETPELNAAQRAAFEEQHRARGSSPIGMTITTDERGARTLTWSCDLWPFDMQEALNVRGALVAASYYSDVADQRYAHGTRSDLHPGGAPALDRLVSVIQQQSQRLLQ